MSMAGHFRLWSGLIHGHLLQQCINKARPRLFAGPLERESPPHLMLHIWSPPNTGGGWHDHQLVTSTAKSDGWWMKGLRHKEIIKCQEKLLRFPSGNLSSLQVKLERWDEIQGQVLGGSHEFDFQQIEHRWRMYPEQLQHQQSECRRGSHLCCGRD